jgi:hypothetical protein
MLMHCLLQKGDRVAADNRVTFCNNTGGRGGRTNAARLLPLLCISDTESCTACATLYTVLTKAARSDEAKNSSAWPVEAKVEVYAAPREVEPGVDLKRNNLIGVACIRTPHRHVD